SLKRGWAAQPRRAKSDLFCLDRTRQGESEGRAFVDLPLRPDPPAVPLHDPLRQREPHAGSLELFGTMQPLEHAEQLVCVLHGEPDTVVLHVICYFRSVLMRADLDPGMRPLGAELEAVVY